jgi:hypothetical protein
MSQLAKYDTFRDLGHKDTAPPPTGYKKIVPILSMTASMTADTRHGWLLMVTSWIFLWRACTPVSCPYVGYESLLSFPNSMVLTSGLQILVMLIWKLLLWNKIISLQVLNLVSWKDII